LTGLFDNIYSWELFCCSKFWCSIFSWDLFWLCYWWVWWEFNNESV